MPPSPLTSIVAALLPHDCPATVLEEVQRPFVKEALQAVLDKDMALFRKSDYAINQIAKRFKQTPDVVREMLADPRMFSEFDFHIPSEHLQARTALRLCVEGTDTACSAALFGWCQDYAPDSLPALHALTAQARLEWATTQATALLSAQPEWESVAPDLRAKAAADVAEAWLEGLESRTKSILFRHWQDLEVAKMNQPALYKWLLKQDFDTIGRYFEKLECKLRDKLQAQFSPAQWAEITRNWYGQPSEESAALLARMFYPEEVSTH